MATDGEPDLQEPQRQEQQILEVLSSLSYRTGELSDYLQAIAQGVSNLIGLDWSVVTLCSNNSERILASTIDLGEEVNQSYSLHGTLTATVIQNGTSLVVEDTTLCTAFGTGPDGYRAYLGVPLRTPTGAVIGTICSFHGQPRPFQPEEVRLAEIFAERAATAIDNYQLYQQQQQRTADLCQANARLQAEIQERQQMEEALRQSEIRFRLLVENAGDAFLLLDPADGQILDANQQACKNLGYTYEELLTLRTPDLDVRFSADALLAFRQRLRLGHPAILESEHRRKDGTTFPVEATVCLFEMGGRSLELALVRDITERKQAEQVQARLAEVGELAAMIVHEVRNPLTTVLMGLTYLQGIDLPEGARVRLDLAMDDAKQLQRLLNEILLFARQPVLDCAELELNGLLEEFVETWRQVPELAGYDMQWIAAAPAWVLGDRDKLKQVFTNLFRNACEAVQRGDRVTCRMQVFPHQLQVQVHNGGAPIPAEQLAKLGTPFFTTKPAGNGLGLAIVRRIVEAHGGKLVITSTATDGTTVSIQLPRIHPAVME